MAEDAAPAVGERILVSITVRVRTVPVGRWTAPRVEIVAIAKSPQTQASHTGEVQAEGEGGKVIVWRALPLTFWKEWAESMWANITSQTPQLFLIYRTEEGELIPALTVAGDEAAGHGEVDDTILSTPMPGWLTEKVEAFVLAHYKPEPKKVRRRQ